jgi:hypothetical protein
MALGTNYTERKGHTPNTATVISSKVRIIAAAANGQGANNSPKQIGVIASFDPTESRSIEPIRGIGYGDQVAELIPGYTEPMSISVNRSAQYLSGLHQVFGYSGGVDGWVRSLKHHKWPFDIVQEVVFSYLVNGFDGNNGTKGSVTNNDGTTDEEDEKGATAASPSSTTLQALKTTFEACWFSDIGTSFTSDTALVQENGTIMVSDVFDDAYTEARERIKTGNTNSSARTSTFGGFNTPAAPATTP